MSKKLLIIEDDKSLAGVLQYNFDSAGYDVYCAHDGEDGINQARQIKPDIILLDLMIPVIEGIEVCKMLRAEQATYRTPIMMLTAKASESDQLQGFSAGADDYVVKPFSVRVLMERVKSLCRRNERLAAGAGDLMVVGEISVDRLKHRASISDKPMDLTPSEFRLLDTLIRHPGRAFDRAELIDLALGGDALVLERTIDVHIRSLRKKMGICAGNIQTVRGVGYRFKES